MEKIIIDTSVLIYEPEILNKIKHGHIYIPLGVLEELDSLKNGANKPTTQYAARVNIRLLSKLWNNMEMSYKDKHKIIEAMSNPVQPGETVDNYLIRLAKELGAKLLTMDLNLSIKARVQGVTSIIYQEESTSTKKAYTGFKTIKIPRELLKDIWAGEEVIPSQYPNLFKRLHPNEFITLVPEDTVTDNTEQALVRFVSSAEALHIVDNKGVTIMGIKPKNNEQYFLIDALLDPNIKLVTATGTSGTGKTLLSVAAAMETVYHKGQFQEIKINKPPYSVGEKLGFLPGDKDEKMMPWLQPFFDAISFIKSSDKGLRKETDFESLINNMFTIEATTFIRGRSIRKSFMIIDECQNLSLHEIKTIITRVAEDTKIVLIGDIEQIDNFYLNRFNNGLSTVISKFKTQKLAAHLTLTKGIRSELATAASKIL